eukprot:NODE_2640_length_334_cov_150.101449_g2630_i0.p2 GENE.NODE_2640_length_334_cov_150.101449_g2630_i0~~NODE_2640_length_334_cov_150.101449_g2630_i0.p2  ORF type:complete len:60 (-),score=15.69 NODE_2640_length_334_cov_150.101449_g2630_i0:154-306(-)
MSTIMNKGDERTHTVGFFHQTGKKHSVSIKSSMPEVILIYFLCQAITCGW